MKMTAHFKAVNFTQALALTHHSHSPEPTPHQKRPLPRKIAAQCRFVSSTQNGMALHQEPCRYRYQPRPVA